MKIYTAFLLLCLVNVPLYAQQGPYQRGLYANRASITDDYTGQTWHYLTQSKYPIVEQKPRGAFSLLDRKVDFEFKKPSGDSAFLKTIVKIRVTSGLDEGRLIDKAAIRINNEVVLLRLGKVATRESILEKKEDIPNSRYKFQTTTIPASTEVVVKSDGTHKLVEHPSSTRQDFVKVLDYESVETKERSYYNQAEAILDQATIAKIILGQKVEIALYFEDNIVTLKPTFTQLSILKSFLNRQ